MSSFIGSKEAKLVTEKDKVFEPGRCSAFAGLFGSAAHQETLTLLAIKNKEYWMVITGAKEFKEPMTAIRAASPEVFESINAFKYALKLYGPERIKEYVKEVPALKKYKNAPQRELSQIFYHANFQGRFCQYSLELEVLSDGQEGSSRIMRVTQLSTHEKISYAEKVSSVADKLRLLETEPSLKQLRVYNEGLERLFKKELEAYVASKKTLPKPSQSSPLKGVVFCQAGKTYEWSLPELKTEAERFK